MDCSSQQCGKLVHFYTKRTFYQYTDKREVTDNCKCIQDISQKVVACSLFQGHTTKCTVKKKKNSIKILIEHCSFLTYHSFDILVTDEVPGWMKHSEKFSDRHTTDFQRQSDQASVSLSLACTMCLETTALQVGKISDCPETEN